MSGNIQFRGKRVDDGGEERLQKKKAEQIKLNDGDGGVVVRWGDPRSHCTLFCPRERIQSLVSCTSGDPNDVLDDGQRASGRCGRGPILLGPAAITPTRGPLLRAWCEACCEEGMRSTTFGQRGRSPLHVSLPASSVFGSRSHFFINWGFWGFLTLHLVWLLLRVLCLSSLCMFSCLLSVLWLSENMIGMMIRT